MEWSDAYSREHPLRSVSKWFVRHFQDHPAIVVDTVHASQVSSDAVHDAGGIILSGSPRDAWVKDPVNDRLGELICECRDRGVPFLGVCFGHQLLAHVMGGDVRRDPAGLELGTVEIELTKQGRQSPLFSGFPDHFEVLGSHQDSVLALPPGAKLLATGLHSRVQAFQCGAHLMGVQFHPEMDPDILRFIWEPRIAAWREKVGFDLQQRLATLRPLPAAANVLRNFANRCLS